MSEIVLSPERYARVTTRGLRLELRQSIIQRFPYSIIFESGGAVTVIAVAHHKRRPNYWRRRLTNSGLKQSAKNPMKCIASFPASNTYSARRKS